MLISSLNDLLEKPFKQFTEEEQHEIIKQGRFTNLTNLCQDDKGKYRMFSTSWYKRIKWLTGNSVNKRLYCWHCVLFPSGPSRIWNFHGFEDLKNLSQAMKKHEDSKAHIYSTIKLKLLMKTKRGDMIGLENRTENNVRIKRNREYLQRLIDIASALAHFQIPFRKPNEDGFYKHLINTFKKYDDVVRMQMEDGSQFKGFTETIQIDLVDSIAEIVKLKIIDEVNAADFFAIQIDGINNSRMCRQIALSVRYVKDAKPIERFLGLYEVPFSKRAEDVVAILEKDLNKLKFKDKMVAQSYDGGVVKYTELYNLQQSFKNFQCTTSRCLFVHAHSHNFCDDILNQSLRSIHDCKLFFSIVDLFGTFFENIALIDVLPNVPVTWTNSVSSCIKTIDEHHLSLIQVLDFINSAEEYQNSTKVIADAINLIFHLKSFKFMLYIRIFQMFYSLIFDSMEILQKNTFDITTCRKEINNLIDNLKNRKGESVFKALISTLPSATGQQVIVSEIFQLYTQIIENIIYEIEGRFLDIELTEYFSLISLEKFTLQAGIKKNPDAPCLQTLTENYAGFFDVSKLKTELDLLYSDPSIVGIGDSIAITKVGDMLKFMYDHEINNYLSNLYKFMSLIVTISSIAEPLEGKDCVLNRIREYCKTEKNEDPKSSLALLTIERELFCALEKTQNWYDQVITYFSQLPSTSSVDLAYKTVADVECLQKNPEKVEIVEPELDIKSENDFAY